MMKLSQEIKYRAFGRMFGKSTRVIISICKQRYCDETFKNHRDSFIIDIVKRYESTDKMSFNERVLLVSYAEGYNVFSSENTPPPIPKKVKAESHTRCHHEYSF